MERASRYSPEVRERAVRMVLVQEKVDFHRPPCPERTSTCRSAIGAGSNRSGSPYCPDPQQWPHGLASGHRVQPAQPDRNADRRWKSVSSAPRLKSRSLSRQITEIQVGQKVLNTMTALGRPVFERIV